MARRLIALTATTAALIAAPAQAIVGGQPADEEYPWMASLQVDEQLICGAALVRPTVALTAAHCVEGEKPERLSVVLGRKRLSTNDGERIGVKAVQQHEGYRTDPNGGHDIALLQLSHASSAATIPIVSLSQAALWAPGKPVRVLGWGATAPEVGSTTDDLMQVDIQIVSDSSCASSYNGAAAGFDAATMVCAGAPLGLKDSCQGDSGGPLIAKAADGWVEVGTVSYGLECGLPLLPGVYGRIGGEELNGWLAKNLADPTDTPTTPGGTSTVKLRFARAAGSAAKARRAKRVRVRIRSSAAVTALTATLSRNGARVGRAALPRLDGRTTLAIPVKTAHRGRLRLRLRATDAAGRRVAATGIVRLSR